MSNGSGPEYVTVRELHEVQLNIVTEIHALSNRVEGYQAAVNQTANQAMTTASRAEKTAGAAHARIDSWTALGIKVAAGAVGTLIALLAGAWRLWVVLGDLQRAINDINGGL